MTVNEQYAMDVWRLGSQGQAPPPAPGTHEAKLLRAWWVARREARKEWARARAAERGAQRERESDERVRTERPGAAGAAPGPVRRRTRRA